MANIPNIKDLIVGGITGIGDAAANIIGKFKADPTKVAEAEAEIEKLKINAALEAQKIANQAEETYAKELETVNQTMREEAKSEHWMVWSWRPAIGFTFCAMLVNNYIVVPYCKKYGIEVIEIPGEVWSAMLVILGAASAGRSFEKTMKK